MAGGAGGAGGADGGARRAAARSAAEIDDERLVVDKAPAPVLARFERAHDRMPGLARVAAGVPVRRGVAAPDLAARQAEAQMHPLAADLQALLTARDLLRDLGDGDLIQMRAVDRHGRSGGSGLGYQL